MVQKKKCFVISPIGDEESSVRRRSDQVLQYIIRPPLEAEGYTVVRADKISEPGIITAQIIERIVEDDLVVADLTEWNPNVFYELAIRHAIRKPYIQLIKRGEKLPFDVAGTRTIFFNVTDLDSVESAKSDVSSQLKSLHAKGDALADSPISTAIDLQALRQSSDPEQRSIGDLVESFAELKQLVAAAMARVDDGPRDAERHLSASLDRTRMTVSELGHLIEKGSYLAERAVATFPQSTKSADAEKFDDTRRMLRELEALMQRMQDVRRMASPDMLRIRRRVVNVE